MPIQHHCSKGGKRRNRGSEGRVCVVVKEGGESGRAKAMSGDALSPFRGRQAVLETINVMIIDVSG
jgi:hypothetical protein